MESNAAFQVVQIKPRIVEGYIWKKSKTIEIIYKWTIKNFRAQTNNDLLSPRFCAEGFPNTIWEMALQQDTEHLYIQLLLYNTDMKEVEASHRFSILNDEGQSVHYLNLNEKRIFDADTDHGFTKFIKKKTLFHPNSGLLANDALSITCSVVFTSHDPCIIHPHHFNDVRIAEEMLSLNLQKLVANEKFSDAVLIVGNKELPVHKYILALQSSVFATMFEIDMEEKRQNRVVITDIDYYVVKEMLNYIYTGNAPNLEGMMFELAIAADKYDLQSLKLMCERAIYENLSIINACEILELSELFTTFSLRETVAFLKKNINDNDFIEKLDRWKGL